MLPAPLEPEVLEPVHEPVSDDREPRERPRMQLWDRCKVLVIIGVVFALLVAKQKADVPIMSLGEAISDQLRSKWWLVLLAGVELARQVHYLVCEHSARYNQFWEQHVWGAWNRRVEKMNPWLRYRINRAFRVAVIGFILLCICAALWNVTLLTALVEAPSRLWDLAFGPLQSMPALIYILFFVGMAIIQFVAIFWFMSKGGVDTYMPTEVKTRFADVWGQDHVLERVRENIVFLEKPEEIESKGGHVPGGILLWGPPGTGKTLMAEAVAGETGRPYVFVDPGAFQNMFFGVGILKVKSLFRKLRKLALRYGGVIVFFDEADSLGSRGGAVSKTPSEVLHDDLFGSHLCNGSHYLSTSAVRTIFTTSLKVPPQAEVPAPGGRKGVVVNPGMGGGGMGTLQALLTELSGLKKPRGFFSRRLRQFFNIKPKQPPKYRILVMMATNMPDSLDPALLRPGRIDRIYRVGYPSKAGRKRTYEGYLDKVKHNISDAQIDKLATVTPYATGATIKDLVNEALIVAMRSGRDTVTWADVVEAKKLKSVGPSENVEYIERERHATAIHEACHAVMSYRVQKGFGIDIATIEKGQGFLGFVQPIPLEERFTEWRTTYEADVLVSLASLAGERMFFGGDNSSGVSGDLQSATTLALAMEGLWGMGSTIGSRGASLAPTGATSVKDGRDRNVLESQLGRRAEEWLQRLYGEAGRILEANRREVLAVAHALETYKTITGDDIEAIIEGRQGPLVDGRPYARPEFLEAAEKYHAVAVAAHEAQSSIAMALPVLEPVAAGASGATPWAPPTVNGNGHANGSGNGHASGTS